MRLAQLAEGSDFYFSEKIIEVITIAIFHIEPQRLEA